MTQHHYITICNHVNDNYFQNGEKAKERTEVNVSKNAADQAASGSHREIILLVGEFERIIHTKMAPSICY